jgi:hypothetical protein
MLTSLTVGSFVYGQEPTQPTQPKPSDAPKVSVTGCLTKAGGAGTYLLADQKSGEKVTFNGPTQLDQYLNQTVKLTGTVVAQGGDKQFKPESINQVAPTCEKEK